MKRGLAWASFGVLLLTLPSLTASCGSDEVDAPAGEGGGAGEGGSPGTLDGGESGAGGGTPQAGAGGGAPTLTGLGTQCMTSADCSDGLICVTEDSTDFGGAGVPGGLCTLDCSGDPTVCGQFANSICLTVDAQDNAYCVQICEFGLRPGAPTDMLDPEKCNGRFEMACGPVAAQTDVSCMTDPDCGADAFCIDGLCLAVIPVCLPQCADNELDCGGLFCNRATGTCQTDEPTGLPLGSACDPEAAEDPCAGACQNVRGPNDELLGVCSEGCTIGVLPGCGWDGTPPAPAACLFVTGLNENPDAGDQGSCAELCDCDDDCVHEDFICAALPATLQMPSGRQGICVIPEVPGEGGIACAPAGGAGGMGGTGGAGGGTGGTAGDGGTGGTNGGTGGTG